MDVYNDGGGYKNISPVLLIGIIIFIIPFFNTILHWNTPGWISGVGVLLILVGAVLSMFKR